MMIRKVAIPGEVYISLLIRLKTRLMLPTRSGTRVVPNTAARGVKREIVGLEICL